MGTMDTILMLGVVGIGGYVLYQNWGTITAGMGGGGGGGGFQQQVFAQPPVTTTYEQPSAQSQPQGDCTGAGTGYCCTDNAGNRCYKGSTSQGVKYVCDEDGNTGCDELRDDFVDQWAVQNQPKSPSGKTNLPTQGTGKCRNPCPKGDFQCGLCCSQGGIWQPTSKCCNCLKKLYGTGTKCCSGTGRSSSSGGGGGGGGAPKPAPRPAVPGRTGPTKAQQCAKFTGATKQACLASAAEYYETFGGGYYDPFEESLQGAPGRCQHLVHSPAAYHACVTNHVSAYNYGPRDGTYQAYEDLDEYGSYSTYWNRNANLAGRAPMRITFG